MSNNYINPESKIGKKTTIEPFSYIDADVEIGNNCWIVIMLQFILEQELVTT